MRLGFTDGWAGRKRKTALCPKCSSDRARYSRRHYKGVWFLLFRVRPVKCSDCGAYFPIAADATIRRPETDPKDLHIPFRPSELDEFVETIEEDPETCPICGSNAIHPTGPGRDPSIGRRLDVRIAYRCARCNGRFMRLSPARLVLVVGSLLVVVGALSYLGTAFLSRQRKSSAPPVQRNQIKPPPPPVFR